ncbi:MAG: hypothetical protein HQ461_02200 [Deltaproteobacteria bacterium]|nr:hypothetical protein [Deltaproteobacteria bacterium]
MRSSIIVLVACLAACSSKESVSTGDSDAGSGQDTSAGSGDATGSGSGNDADTTPEDTGASACELTLPPATGTACDCLGATRDFPFNATGPLTCSCTDRGWACAAVEPEPDTTADDTTADTAVDDTTPDDTTPDDTAADTAVDDTTDDTTADTTPDTTPVGPCEAGGGVCIGMGGPCETVGGTPYPAGNSQCVFTGELGSCCVPPPAQPTGDTCADRGGVCAPIAGCNFTNSAFAPTPTPSCGFGGIICCVPNTVCGEETMRCCDTMTSFRPACDRGQWICTIDGTTMLPISECP